MDKIEEAFRDLTGICADNEPPMTTVIHLTDQELLLLDSFVEISASTREAVIEAKLRQSLLSEGLAPKDAKLIQRIVSVARKERRLTFVREGVRQCFTCGTKAGYAPYKTSCKAGRKGEPNLSKPRVLSAIDFDAGFIRIRGHVTVGACFGCVDRLKLRILAALEGIECEIPQAFSGVEPAFQRVEKMRCSKCKWEGPKTDMRKRDSFMGGGKVHAICPKCNAENKPFGEMVVAYISGEYVLVPLAKASINCDKHEGA